MKITVEHEVSPDKNFCTYGGDFWGKDVCPYHTHRDRTHGRKATVEKQVPKCTLFGVWLDKPYQKCKECIKACEQEETSLATRAEINEKYGIVRLMPTDVANEQLSEEDAAM